MRFLIVDDDPVCLEKLNAILSDAGDCTLAGSGEEALRHLDEAFLSGHPFHLITLDIELPGISGVHLLKDIRALEASWATGREKPARILMVTSSHEEHDVITCLRQGCDGFILKPFSKKVIYDALARFWPDQPSFRLPEPALPPREPAARMQECFPAQAEARERRVLIVDDDEVSRTKMELLLEEFGPCDTAESGLEGLDKFFKALRAGRGYLLVTLDVEMPDMLGPEVLARMREEESRPANAGRIAPARIVIVTAHSGQQIVQETIRSGCSGYLVKPFDKAQIEALLEKLFPNPVPAPVRRGEGAWGEPVPAGRHDQVLSLLDRLLQETESESFRSVIEALEKSFQPSDVSLFVSYLNHGSCWVAEGALEILARCADRQAFSAIWHHVRKKIEALDFSPLESEPSLGRTAAHLHAYLQRFPELAENCYPELKKAWQAAHDPMLKRYLAEMLALARDPRSAQAARLRQLLEHGALIPEEEFLSTASDLIAGLGESADRILQPFLEAALPGNRLVIRVLSVLGRRPQEGLLPSIRAAAERSSFPLAVRKQAVTALSMIGNEKALNCLTALQESAGNSILAQFIQSEVRNLMQRSPDLALIPNFLLGQKDSKAFQVALRLLKKKVKPQDLPVFVGYLSESEDPMVQLGAFELICEKGGVREEPEVIRFARKKLAECLGQPPESMELPASLLIPLNRFAADHPFVVVSLAAELRQVFEVCRSAAARQLLLQIQLKNPQGNFAEEVMELFRNRPEMRAQLVEPLAFHPQGMAFLIQSWEEGGFLREKILSALLRNPASAEYFLRKIPEMNRDLLLSLLRNIPAENYLLFRPAVAPLLLSPDAEVCRQAMELVGNHADFATGEMLLAREREKRYWEIAPDYPATLARLFPVEALARCFARAADGGREFLFSKPQANGVLRLLELEPVLRIDGLSRAGFLGFFRSLLHAPSRSDFVELLRVMQRWRCLDLETLGVFQEALSLFQQFRNSKSPPEEVLEVKKCRDLFAACYAEIKGMNDGLKELQILLHTEPLPVDALEKILVLQPQAAALGLQKILGKWREAAGRGRSPEGWDRLGRRFPVLGLLAGGREEEALTFCIFVDSKELYAGLRDQIRQLFPGFRVRERAEPRPQDILLADGKIFESMVAARKLPVHRAVVFLQSPAEFAALKHYQPITFSAPVSLYRVVRGLMQEWLK